MSSEGREDRIRAALTAWAAFPAAREPRPFVLLSSPVQASGFPDDVTQRAYLHGAVEAADDFPAPVLAALRDAMRGWPRVRRRSNVRSTGDGGYPGPPLRLVSAAGGGTTPFDTDRGPRDLPVWQVRVRDEHGHEHAPIAVLDPGCATWRPLGGEPVSWYGSRAAVAADGRTLTVSLLVSPGTRTESPVRTLEAGSAVALFWPEPEPPVRPGSHAGPTRAEGSRPPTISPAQRHEAAVLLAQPLGDRVLLDGHGAPVPVIPAA